MCFGRSLLFKLSFPWCSQGAELIRVSRFYKEGKEGKFVSFLHEDTRTLYDGFRRGAKESSKLFRRKKQREHERTNERTNETYRTQSCFRER